jgi:DNA-binding LacI/PurR family transcriptional regulator
VAQQNQHRVTLRDVAKEAGLSVMTVSYAFNNPGRVSEESLQRVIKASKDLGYAGKNPWATTLKTGKSNNLGVVFGEHLTYAFSDPQAVEFLAGVSSVCVERHLGLTFIPTEGSPDDASRVCEAAVDGYVFWTTVEDDPTLGAAVLTGRPCAIQGGPEYDGIVRVRTDDYTAARAMSRTMSGTANLVIVSFSLDHSRTPRQGYGLDISQAKLPVTKDRLQGFRDGLEEDGFDWADVYVVALSRNHRTEAKATFDALLRDGKISVDGVLCMSDELALGVLEAASEHGLAVPGNLSVSGWDDGPAAADVGLTSLRQSLYEQGRICGQIAAGLTVDSPQPSWSVVERESTRR